MRSEMTLLKFANQKHGGGKKKAEMLNVVDILSSFLCGYSCCHFTSPPLEGEFSSIFSEDVHRVTGYFTAGWDHQTSAVKF